MRLAAAVETLEAGACSAKATADVFALTTSTELHGLGGHLLDGTRLLGTDAGSFGGLNHLLGSGGLLSLLGRHDEE